MANPTNCRNCSSYDPRSRWCEYGEGFVRNPSLGTCGGYDGPSDDELEELLDEAEADFQLNYQREAEV